MQCPTHLEVITAPYQTAHLQAMSETAPQSCRTGLWVEPGIHPESSTHQIKIQPGPNNNEPEVQTHGRDRKDMKGDQWESYRPDP